MQGLEALLLPALNSRKKILSKDTLYENSLAHLFLLRWEGNMAYESYP